MDARMFWRFYRYAVDAYHTQRSAALDGYLQRLETDASDEQREMLAWASRNDFPSPAAVRSHFHPDAYERVAPPWANRRKHDATR